ncbi:MAG: hypothetical protein V4563_15115 [Pseudomonadota bacterium]
MDALDRIALEAGGGEAEAQAVEDAMINPPPAIDPAETWAQIPMMVGGLLAMAMPELKAAYSQTNCMNWGQSMQALADKYGWDAATTMAKWAPEIGVIVASIPLVLPTVSAFKARKQTPEKITVSEDVAKEQTPVPMPEAGGLIEPS